MLTIFVNYRGPLVVDVLPEGVTVTATLYGQVVIPKLVRSIENQQRRTGTTQTFILDNNASSHRAVGVVEKLAREKFKMLDHPPYSQDLAPCNFWLFPYVKSRLANTPFQSVQDLVRAIWAILRDTPENEFRHVFESWIMRLQRSIERGEFFEGL